MIRRPENNRDLLPNRSIDHAESDKEFQIIGNEHITDDERRAYVVKLKWHHSFPTHFIPPASFLLQQRQYFVLIDVQYYSFGIANAQDSGIPISIPGRSRKHNAKERMRV
jgi:hypothetical protein